MLSKSIVSNLVSLSLVLIGLLAEIPYQQHVLTMGLYALSGGLTNWLAIHMLFEKIPLLYGSGIIPNRFHEFRQAIYRMMMEQFFNQSQVQKFIENAPSSSAMDMQAIADTLDYDQIYESLIQSITESSLGGMLAMIGGKEALEPVREPLKEKIRQLFIQEGSKLIAGASQKDQPVADILVRKLEAMIQARLEELTPQMVKEIVQQMIKQHLGWLVVWGNVFGGAIGLLVSFY